MSGTYTFHVPTTNTISDTIRFEFSQDCSAGEDFIMKNSRIYVVPDNKWYKVTESELSQSSCSTIYGDGSVTINNDVFEFDYNTDDGGVLRCDTPLDIIFDEIIGSFDIVIVGDQHPDDTRSINRWGELHDGCEGSFAFGTPQNIIVPGSTLGGGDIDSGYVNIPKTTAVSDTLRFEFKQQCSHSEDFSMTNVNIFVKPNGDWYKITNDEFDS
eukprot:UN31204